MAAEEQSEVDVSMSETKGSRLPADEDDILSFADADDWPDQADRVHRFATGAVRSKDADDVRYDLISPIAMEELARTCAEGAAKYGDFNWERGMPVHDLLNHVIRHIYKYLSGDRSESHLPHAMWGIGAAIHSEVLWSNLNCGHLRDEGCRPPMEGTDDASSL